MHRGRPGTSLWLSSLLLLTACAEEAPAQGSALGLRDPAGVLADVVGDLRLLLLPAEAYPCDPATGQLTPNPDEAAGAPIDDSVVDLSFGTADSATVNVRPGMWSILVRGRGDDMVTMRSDVVICSGCAGEMIADGETREITIELKQVASAGLCGDGTLSPDEQCEDGGTTPGDGCDATCRSEDFLVSRRAGGEAAGETLPSAGWTANSRAVVSYDANTGSREVQMIYLSESGEPIEMPAALQVDTPAAVFPAVQTVSSAAANGGRMAIAFADFQGTSMGGDVYVGFYDANRTPAAMPTLATTDSTGVQSEPALALMPDGAAMVVFTDSESATGLSGRVYPAGMTAPAGTAAFEVATGATGATTPAIGGHMGGFVVAYAAGGTVFHQRFGADGTPMDAAGVSAGGGNTPAVASLADGRTIVAWQSGEVQALVIDAAGVAGAPFAVNTTPGGGSAVAAAAGQERFVVVWQGTDIRARLFDGSGNAALNREETPTSDDFIVATGAVSEPSVAAGGTAAEPRWLAVWRDDAMDPMGDVRGRVFALP